jgi:hypothetical protein
MKSLNGLRERLRGTADDCRLLARASDHDDLHHPDSIVPQARDDIETVITAEASLAITLDQIVIDGRSTV